MDNYRLDILHPYVMLKRWDELLPHIDKVVKVSNNEFSAESIKNRVITNNGLMIAVFDKNEKIVAVTTAEVVIYDSGLKSLLIPIFVGEDLVDWGLEWLELLTDIALSFECTELRGLSVRGGWMRLLKNYGWQENHVVMTMPIKKEVQS